MKSTTMLASVLASGLVAGVSVSGCGRSVDGAMTPSQADRTVAIASPAFGDGSAIPARYTCAGANVAPPLTWSAPLTAALVVDDPDAPAGPFVHWIVVGIPPGRGNTADGQTPAGAASLANSAGQVGYSGPCPPPGSGVHHYRFTLYQLPATFQVPPGLAGLQAAQAIARATAGRAQFTGTFGE